MYPNSQMENHSTNFQVYITENERMRPNDPIDGRKTAQDFSHMIKSGEVGLNNFDLQTDFKDMNSLRHSF